MWKRFTRKSSGFMSFKVSEGLNSVETRLVKEREEEDTDVSEGLNSVETTLVVCVRQSHL